MSYLYPLGAMVAAGLALPKVFSAIGGGKYPVTYVKTDGGEEVLVRDLPDKKHAADNLIEIRRRCFLLKDVVTKNFPDDERTKRLHANFDNHTVFTEGTPDSSFTSYTKNKGEKIVFCLRQRNDKEELVDINTMMFVAIHEMGHVICPETGHTPLFWDCFAWLLRQAIDHGIYEEQNFKLNPVEYCGTTITGSPLK